MTDLPADEAFRYRADARASRAFLGEPPRGGTGAVIPATTLALAASAIRDAEAIYAEAARHFARYARESLMTQPASDTDADALHLLRPMIDGRHVASARLHLTATACACVLMDPTGLEVGYGLGATLLQAVSDAGHEYKARLAGAPRFVRSPEQ